MDTALLGGGLFLTCVAPCPALPRPGGGSEGEPGLLALRPSELGPRPVPPLCHRPTLASSAISLVHLIPLLCPKYYDYC